MLQTVLFVSINDENQFHPQITHSWMLSKLLIQNVGNLLQMSSNLHNFSAILTYFSRILRGLAYNIAKCRYTAHVPSK